MYNWSLSEVELLMRDLLLGFPNRAHLKHCFFDLSFEVIFLNRRLIIDYIFNFLIPSVHEIFKELVLLQLFNQELHLALRRSITINWCFHHHFQAIKI
jgi:hypothetical protein